VKKKFKKFLEDYEMNILNKMYSYIRGEDFDEEEELEEITASEEPRKELTNIATFRPRRDNSKIVSIHTNVQMQVVITYPCDVDDAASSCDYLKQNKTCIINLEGVERANAQRIADFLGGAAYAINGDIQRVSNDIFIVAPANVNITGELKEELKANGLILPWVSSSFK
jgi:Uncharacterized protein conserved in bacteria